MSNEHHFQEKRLKHGIQPFSYTFKHLGHDSLVVLQVYKSSVTLSFKGNPCNTFEAMADWEAVSNKFFLPNHSDVECHSSQHYFEEELTDTHEHYFVAKGKRVHPQAFNVYLETFVANQSSQFTFLDTKECLDIVTQFYEYYAQNFQKDARYFVQPLTFYAANTIKKNNIPIDLEKITSDAFDIINRIK